MKLALCVAVGLLAACGPDGKRVTVLHVEDETTGPVTPTVPGAEELTFAAADDATIHGSYWAPDARHHRVRGVRAPAQLDPRRVRAGDRAAQGHGAPVRDRSARSRRLDTRGPTAR
jgi:hypothetical protein